MAGWAGPSAIHDRRCRSIRRRSERSHTVPSAGTCGCGSVTVAHPCLLGPVAVSLSRSHTAVCWDLWLWVFHSHTPLSAGTFDCGTNFCRLAFVAK